MSTLSKNRLALIASVIVLFVGTHAGSGLAATISKSNGAIILTEQQSGEPDLKTVNGRIAVGDGLQVGNVRTTNGSISIGEKSRAKQVRTVNGSISIDTGSTVDEVRTTNGSMRLTQVRVKGDLQTTNGSIKASDNTHVEGSVLTTNGGVYLDEASVDNDVRFANGKTVLNDSTVGGNIVVDESSHQHGWSLFGWGKNKKPVLIIGRKSIVKGDIIAHQDIELYIHESAQVGGIEGAEAQYFKGERP